MTYKLYWNDTANLPGLLEAAVENLSSWDEYHALIDRIIQETETTSLDRIDVIVSGSGRMPRGNPIPHIQRTYRGLVGREKLGLLLVVTANAGKLEGQLLQLAGQIVLKTVGVAMSQIKMIVDSHEEALQLIREDRANINNKDWEALRQRNSHS
jgi:hypothetical protein